MTLKSKFIISLVVLILSFGCSFSQCTLDNAPSGQYIDLNSCTYVDASPGFFSTGGNVTSATPCAAGAFSNTSGSTSCADCPVGTFQGNTGSTNCVACPPGTFQIHTGSTECVNCPPGRFTSTSGNIFCTDCPLGTSQPNSGSTNCIDCTPGKFSDTTGNAVCTDCPIGTFQANSGSIECENCPSGSSTSSPGAISCDVTLSIFKNTFEESINYYPNPSNGITTFSFNKTYENLLIKLYDLRGSLLYEEKLQNASEIIVNMIQFSSGQYITEISSTDNQATFRILKK